jgi:predicted phage terminase large subunit-like protein
MSEEYELAVAKKRCTAKHLDFTRFFFKHRHGAKFILNWHHYYIADEVEKVFTCETENLMINVPPGSSKTEIVVINLIARGLAINPRARFLHLSYSDDLALLNSQTAREIIRSDVFQKLWPLEIASDTKAKKRWNIMHNGNLAGGVYATSLSGQVTGFRAGHMAEGFQGAIVIDDPMKPEDAYSKTKVDAANRKLLTTVKSRKAHPKTPIVVIMQRISSGDPVKFIQDGNLPGEWKHVVIPAIIDDAYVKNLPEKYHALVDSSVKDDKGRFSYWEYKEPIKDLVAMESGSGKDQHGAQISRSVFAAQWQQSPTLAGGNLFKGNEFIRYTVHPKLKYRMIYADTAQKIKEHNDYSVFQCWGLGIDHKVYLLDQIRGKWEAPDLVTRAREFWKKHAARNDDDLNGFLRKIKPEDKVSGTGLIQYLRTGDEKNAPIPVEGIERNKDKVQRANDGLPYIQAGMVCVPADAPWLNDYISEFEGFSPDMTHLHDDQIDPTLDAIEDMISTKNKLKVWERIGGQ